MNLLQIFHIGDVYSEGGTGAIAAWMGILGAVLGGVVGSYVAYVLAMRKRKFDLEQRKEEKAIEVRERKAEKALAVISNLKSLSYELVECAEEALMQSLKYNLATALKKQNFTYSGSPDEWQRQHDEFTNSFEIFKTERRRFIAFIGRCEALLLEFSAYMEPGQSMQEFTYPLTAYVIDPFNNIPFFSQDVLGAPNQLIFEASVYEKYLPELQKILNDLISFMLERFYQLNEERRVEKIL